MKHLNDIEKVAAMASLSALAVFFYGFDTVIMRLFTSSTFAYFAQS
jgi:hypothetical protein